MALSSSTIHSQVCYQATDTVLAADEVNKSYFTLKIAFCKKKKKYGISHLHYTVTLLLVSVKALSHGTRQSRVSSSFSMGDMRQAAKRGRFCWRRGGGAQAVLSAPKILPLPRARRFAAGAAKDKNILSFCERQPRRFQPVTELIINNHV